MASLFYGGLIVMLLFVGVHMSPRALESHPTDVIVINRRKSGRWSWRRDGNRFEERDFVVSEMDEADEVHEFHMELFAPNSPWHVVYETDDVVILERRDAVAGFDD